MNTRQIFKTVSHVSEITGIDAYVVGGFVRDELLGIEQKKDIDFVVLGSGLAFAQAFDEALEHVGRLVEFSEFDTARYIFVHEPQSALRKVAYLSLPSPIRGEEFEIEFAGARSESYRESSRKPAVMSATLEEDLSRRDFTVNAMAQKVGAGGKLGKIIDPFGGQKDLKDGILRTPLDPNITFFDDPLRMLRAARFAAQLQFAIEPTTIKAMHDNTARLKIVSTERIQDEFMKLLAASKPSVGLWLLHGTRLLDQFLPEVAELEGVEEVFGYKHKDNLSHTFAVVDNIAEHAPKPILRYAGLLHDIAKPRTKRFVRGRGWTFDMHEHLGKKMAREINQRLRLSVDDSKFVCKLIRWHLQPIALMDEGITDSAVRRLFMTIKDDLPDLLILCRSDITTGNQKKKEFRLKNYDKLESRIEEIIAKDKLRAFHSPVRGEEIMKESGLKAGPTVGKIKKEIERAILEGEIPNEYEAALAYLLSVKDKYIQEAEEWERFSNQ